MHLWILLGASLLLLGASILSASNLILSHILSCRTEIATRLALGTRRGQLLAQFGAEGAVMASLAALGGLAFAYLAVRTLRGLPSSFPGTTGARTPVVAGIVADPSDGEI
jgi:ABC-type antimicrobial peptide transport system permease subunit